MKMMKKLLLTALILSLLLPATVFAADGETIKVKGYIFPETEQEYIDQTPYHFSITNVIDAVNGKENNLDTDATVIVDSPSEVTILEGGGVLFDVYKLHLIGENEYEYYYDETVPVEGKVKVYVPDESVGLDEWGSPTFVEKIIDASELDNYEVDFPVYQTGSKVVLTEPGDYFVLYRFEAIAGSASAFITVRDTDAEEEVVETVEEAEEPATEQDETENKVIATPTNSKVLVNGEEVEFEAYNINDNNYFKLRDLALVVSETEKSFEVGWDNENKVISLVSGQNYSPVGGELQKGDGAAKEGILNESKILKDGEELELTAYTINDNNYFKLRDIAQAFDIGITWDNSTKTIGIDTTIGYTAE